MGCSLPSLSSRKSGTPSRARRCASAYMTSVPCSNASWYASANSGSAFLSRVIDMRPTPASAAALVCVCPCATSSRTRFRFRFETVLTFDATVP